MLIYVNLKIMNNIIFYWLNEKVIKLEFGKDMRLWMLSVFENDLVFLLVLL